MSRLLLSRTAAIVFLGLCVLCVSVFHLSGVLKHGGTEVTERKIVVLDYVAEKSGSSLLRFVFAVDLG